MKKSLSDHTWFLILLFLSLACSKSAVDPDSGSVDSSDSNGVSLITSIELETFEETPLSRAVHVELTAPAAIRLEFWQDSGPHFERQFTEVESSQTLPLLGLKSASETYLIVHAETGEVSESSSIIEFETAALDVEFFIEMGAFTGTVSDGSMIVFEAQPQNAADGENLFVGVDRSGEVVWTYENTVQRLGLATYMEPIGDQFVYRAKFGAVFIDSLGQLKHNVRLERLCDHDLAIKPGGDLLLITHEARMVQTEKWGEIEIRGSGLIEADLDGQETWAWSAFDHLDTERFPNGMSEPRDGVSDWTHANSVQFIEERNQILVSVRNQSQVLLIDRATGDVVWTLGVDGDFELLSGTWFSGQHDASMQPDGSILLYDNGNLKPGNPPTRIVRYVLNEETLQAEEVMDLDMGVLMISMGGVVPLDNGNFLVTLGGHRNRDTPATIVEMSPDGETVWRMAIGPSEPFRTIYRGNVFQFAQPIQ